MVIAVASLVAFSSGCGAGGNDVVVPVAGAPQARQESADPPSDFSPSSGTVSAPTTTGPPSTPATTTNPTVPDTTLPASTTSTTTSTTTTSTLPLPPPPAREIANPFFEASNAAFDRLAGANAAASMTVVRGGEIVFTRGSGPTIDGGVATGDSPMVVASVSKIVVALAVARLHERGLLDVGRPVPWSDLGLDPDPAWVDVTIRELLDHRSGLAKARFSWFTGEGTCRDYIPSLLASPPKSHRGSWVYSNGNYCLLGLLIEQRTAQPLDTALQQLVFDPVGASGVHLTYDGLQPGDVPHPDDVARLSRLGGAGTLIVSTDDTALALGRLTPTDRSILQPPGVFIDQYGWGHTGTIDGAKACIWILDDGDTVVSATIAGNSVSAGGGVCDTVVPAVAWDLGIDLGRPDRTP